MIAAHGNSLRAMVKYLDNMTDAEIMKLNIPTGGYFGVVIYTNTCVCLYLGYYSDLKNFNNAPLAWRYCSFEVFDNVIYSRFIYKYLEKYKYYSTTRNNKL